MQLGCKLTLDVGNALLEDLLKDLGVLQLLLDLGNNSLGKLLLLAGLDLALVTHPRVENGLGLSGNGSLLLELKGLGLELGSLLLKIVNDPSLQVNKATSHGIVQKRVCLPPNRCD